MTKHTEDDDVQAFWDRVAQDWETQVGEDGDDNRRLNSDPTLWRLAGDVKGLRVLDAGCGTGYLTRKLHRKGAIVTGVDLSPKMIRIARSKSAKIPFLTDSCATLAKLGDGQFDLVIANYVLMDVPDFEAALRAFSRVLKTGGHAVLVFSHPCFPQGRAEVVDDGRTITYQWPFPYFERSKRVDPPWGHFTSDFIWFHRSLSDYWKAFKHAGFEVTDLEEPRLTEERFHMARNERTLRNGRTRPYSIAFRLVKERPAG